MQSKKVIAKLIIWILAVGIQALGVYSRKEESAIQMFDIADVQQCIWGEWEINEGYYGGVGWQECIDNKKGMHIQFLPDSIVCNGQATDIDIYYNQLLAIKDENAQYFEVKFRDFRFSGRLLFGV